MVLRGSQIVREAEKSEKNTNKNTWGYSGRQRLEEREKNSRDKNKNSNGTHRKNGE